MREGSAELMARVIESFGQGDVEAALEYIHPEIVWRAAPEWLEDRTYEGHDALRRLVSQWQDRFRGYRLDLERATEIDETRALALVYQRGTIGESGVAVEQQVALIGAFREALLAEVDVFFSWREGIEAAGIEA